MTPRQEAVQLTAIECIKAGYTNPVSWDVINYAYALDGSKGAIAYIGKLKYSSTATTRFCNDVKKRIVNLLASNNLDDKQLLQTQDLPLDVLICLANYGSVDIYGGAQLYYHGRLLIDIATDDIALCMAVRLNIDEWLNDDELLANVNNIGDDMYKHAAFKPDGWQDVNTMSYTKDFDDTLLTALHKADSCSLSLPMNEIILYFCGLPIAYIPQSFSGSAYGVAEKMIRAYEHVEYFQFPEHTAVRRETRKARPAKDTHLLQSFIEYLVDTGNIKVFGEGDMLSDAALHIIREVYKRGLWRINQVLHIQDAKQLLINLVRQPLQKEGDDPLPFPAVFIVSDTLIGIRPPTLHSNTVSQDDLQKLRLFLVKSGRYHNNADLIVWDAELMNTLLEKDLISDKEIWLSMVSEQKKQDVRLALLPADDEDAMNELREVFTQGFAYALALRHKYSTTRIVNMNSRYALEILQDIVFVESLEREALQMRQIYNAIILQDEAIRNALFNDAIQKACFIKVDYVPMGVWQELIQEKYFEYKKHVEASKTKDLIDELISVCAWDLANYCKFSFETIQNKSQNVLERVVKITMETETATHHFKAWKTENATGRLHIIKGIRSRAMMFRANHPRPTWFEDFEESENV